MEAIAGSNASVNGLTSKVYAQLISMLNLERTHNSATNFAGKASSLPNCNIEWVLDSGASNHMTCHVNAIPSHKTMPHFSPITIPDGSLIPTKFYGDISLNPFVTLNNVLYIPSFTCVRSRFHV